MKCPGQDMQYWNAEAIFEVNCPQCKKPVEFYKDDTNRRCHSCGHRFVNPKMDFGCAAYCQYAEQCLGTLPEEFVGTQEGLLKDKVAVEMKRYFKSDFHRIGHATRVARYAESMGKNEECNLAALLCAAYLHNTGDGGAAAATGASASMIAREILTRLQAKEQMTDFVCTLLEDVQEQKNSEMIELAILADAKKLALLEENCKQGANLSPENVREYLQEMQTGEGRQLVEKIVASYSA